MRHVRMGWGILVAVLLVAGMVGCGTTNGNVVAKVPVTATALLATTSTVIARSTPPPTNNATPLTVKCATPNASGNEGHGIPLPAGLYAQDGADQRATHYATGYCGSAIFAFFLAALGPAGWSILAADQQTPQQYLIRCQQAGNTLTIAIIDYARGDGAYVVIATA